MNARAKVAGLMMRADAAAALSQLDVFIWVLNRSVRCAVVSSCWAAGLSTADNIPIRCRASSRWRSGASDVSLAAALRRATV